MSFLGTGQKDSKDPKEGENDVGNTSEGRLREKANLQFPCKG